MIFPSPPTVPIPHIAKKEKMTGPLCFLKKKYYYCISIIGITFPIQRKDTFKRPINEAP